MKPRDFVEAVYEATLPRILSIREAVAQAGEEELQKQIAAGEWPELAGREPSPPSERMTERVTRIVWGAPLSDITVQLVWTLMGERDMGDFLIDQAALDKACAAIDEKELKDSTGLSDEHLRPVLTQVAAALLEVVRSHGTIEFEVDRAAVRFIAAP